ncbi:MAG TPA: gluconate 2-dehydrogenase subunit 3 family protein [Gemmatimonadaceae bacterium]
MPSLVRVRPVFRAVAITVVPEAALLDAAGWTEFEALVERALRQRPPRVRRQLLMFLRAIDFLALTRCGRRFEQLDARQRVRILTALQDSPILLVRRGFWGLRTLIFLGYYAQPGVAAQIGYRAHRDGWLARGLPDEAALARSRSTP